MSDKIRDVKKTYFLNILNIPAYYINLDEDVEKRHEIESTLRSLGFKSIYRVPGHKEATKRIGVAKSHYDALSIISKKGLPAIVFEDDVSVFNFKTGINVPQDADAYYLGNSSWGIYGGKGQLKISISKFDEDTYKIHNMLAAHAILYLNKDYVDFLNKAIQFNISIETNQDKARAETMKYFNIYSAASPMFYQNGAHERFTKLELPPKRFVGPEGAY